MRTICVIMSLLVSIMLVHITIDTAESATREGWPRVIVFSGAYTGSGVYMAGAAIADAITKELGVPAQVMGGMTTPQTIKLQEQKQIIGGFEMADTLFDAITGQVAFKGRPQKGVRILCVWDVLNWLLNSYTGSGVSTGADLKGKKWMVLKPGSRYGDDMADGMLDAHGWTRDDVKLLPWAALRSFSDAMRSRTVHAILWPWSPGSPHGEDLARSIKLVYISLTEKEAEAMKKRGPYLVAKVLSPNTYPGQKEPMRVIADPTFFGIGGWVPESLVYELCRLMMDDPKRFTSAHRKFGDFSFEKSFMSAPAPVPYHSGVIKYLKEKGQWNQQLQSWHDEALAKLK